MKYSLRTLLVMVYAASVLVGCARVGPLSSTSPRTVELSVFNLRWSQNIMPDIPAYRERANPIQGSVPEVDASGNRVFVGSADHHIYCLRAGTGEVLWRRDTGAAIRSQPLFMEETQVLFLGTDDGQLWALGAEDGDQRWVYQAEAEIIHQPVLEGEALYITSADNTVHVIDWTDGEQIWRYTHEPSEGEFVVGGFAGIALSRGVVYTGFSDGSVIAFDANDGSVIWVRDLSDDIPPRSRTRGLPVLPDVDTTPLVGQRYIFVASYDGGIYALDRVSGAIIWREPSRGVIFLFGINNTIFAARASYGVIALDADDGSMRWQRPLGSANYFRPSIFRDLLIVTDSQRGITALRLENGDVLQRYTVGSGAGGNATIVGSTAFVLSNGGVLAALRLR